jgi:hypothetical protein
MKTLDPSALRVKPSAGNFSKLKEYRMSKKIFKGYSIAELRMWRSKIDAEVRRRQREALRDAAMTCNDGLEDVLMQSIMALDPEIEIH